MARKRIEHQPPQMTFLSPEDAELLHRGRLALAEFVAIYEARKAKRLEEAPQIKSPEDAFEYLRFEMENLEQEQLHAINLNQKNRIISARMIYQGSLHTTVVRVGEVFRLAVLDNAASLIVAHNHPSGTPDPSPEDVALTRELVKAGQLLDIAVLDHIVIGRGKFVSLKERGLGFDR
jgi:DNA repair protein RadC